MGRLSGKTAIVTGAAVGMGRAFALTLASEGANVVVNYSRSEHDAAETARRVEAAGASALLSQADVADDAAVRRMVAAAVERFRSIDILVNNAGITAFVPFPDLEGLTDDVWDRLYDVNVKGTFFCCRAVAPVMRTGGGGRIINLASIAGVRPQGSAIAYSVSKAAVIHLSKCLAKTLGPEITVNVVAPGFIEGTRWNEGRPNLDATLRAAAQAAALKRNGTPEDVASAVLYLATDASFMTGSVLMVDGGRYLA